jgi:LPXTG-motif cell wall-anchored protein
MRLRPWSAALAVAALLVTPSAALAQSAGDNQYQDPFAGQSGGGGSSGGSGGSGGGGQSSHASQGSGSSSGGQSSGGGSTLGQSAGTTQSTTSQQATPGPQLPRTGGEPSLVALLGAGLIVAGAGLRLRVRRSAA